MKMKTITFLKINIVTAFIALVFLLTLISCQKEETIIIDKPKEDQKLTIDSPFTNLMSRVTQNPTSKDNVLDKSSCVSVNLPVGVTINDISFVANTYQQVQAAIDAVANPTPVNTAVHMTFPIQVVAKDYSVLSITSQSQMDTTLNTCGVETGLNEIDCIKLKYPVSIAIYNTNSQRISTFNFGNNSQFYNFLKNGLSEDIIANINYPLELYDVNNQKVTVFSNQELEALIKNAIEVCN
jgi:hypothetical protein